MSTEILSFIIPQNDTIQITFFLLIFGFAAATIWFVKKKARPETWELNWCGGTLDDHSDDLDAEHGSVIEISNAVATTPEKLAEIMPGILLVFGLLGTFLGLGMALNKASSILMDAGSAAGGMDGAMSNLMGMMQGLGTKFKTSTWGIMAFLGLRAWISINGFEEKRLQWSIRKMKFEIDKSRAKELDRTDTVNRELIGSIRQLGSDLCATLQIEISENRTVLRRNQDLLSEKKEIASQAFGGIKALTKLSEMQIKKQDEMVEHSKATRKALEDFVNASAANIASMKESAGAMATSAGKVGDSAGDLRLAIQSFQTGVAEVLDLLKRDLSSTIADMSANFNKNLGTIEASLVGATKDISTSVGSLSTNVEKTMVEVKSSIEQSLDMQKKAQAIFSETSLTLNTTVEEMTNLIKRVCENIESGLRAVSENGRRMTSLDSRYKDITQNAEEVAGEIKAMAAQIADGISRFGDPSERFSKVVTALENIQAEIGRRDKVLAEQIAQGTAGFGASSANLGKVIELLNGIRNEVGRSGTIEAVPNALIPASA